MEFINENYISSLLQSGELLDESYQKETILKGLDARGLSLKESAALLNINSPELLEELFHSAKKVKGVPLRFICRRRKTTPEKNRNRLIKY